MTSSVFVELRFWLLIAFSVAAPASIYFFLYRSASISRAAVLSLGFILVSISGIDVYLLQVLATLAKQTSSLLDDAIFASEISVALYVVPIAFGGVGVNVVSHILIEHLARVEGRNRREHVEIRNDCENLHSSQMGLRAY